MNKDFQLKADKLLLENINKTREYIISNRKQLVSAFTGHFTEACLKIAQLQNEQSMPPVASIECTMLRTNFINRSYVAETWAYGDGWHASPHKRMAGELDLFAQFACFDKMWDELIKEKNQRYHDEVSPLEVKAYMMEALPSFYLPLANVARAAMAGIMDSNALAGINKHKSFRVCVGELMNNNQTPIYIENKEKSASETMKRIDNINSGPFDFGDYSCMDFSGCDFSMMDLSYSRFSHSNFSGSIFHKTELGGANFHNAIMDNCRITKCAVHEANFSHASLKGASFEGSQGNAATPTSSSLQFADNVGLMPVSFRHADLSNACFRNACLAGADFEGARLDGADFADAVLSGANFANASLTDTDFTDADLEGAVFESPAANREKDDGERGTGERAQSPGTDGCQSTRYFLMEGPERKSLPPAGELIKATIIDCIPKVNEIDYDAKSGLISDRLKTLMETHLPAYEFGHVPSAFMSEDRSAAAFYWKFNPPAYDAFSAAFKHDLITHVKFNDINVPPIFTAMSPKGKRSIAVSMPVAESALRRGIMGLKFTRLLDCDDATA